MFARRQLTAIGALVLAACPTLAWGDPVVLTSSFRLALATASVGSGAFDGENQTNGDVLRATASVSSGPNTAASSAELTSSLAADNHAFAGVGNLASSATSITNRATSFAETAYDVRFEIEQAHRWELVASFLTSASEPQSDLNFTMWTIAGTFLPPPFESPNFFRYSGRDSRTITATGLLQPGWYAFGVGTRTRAFRDPGEGTALSTLAFDFAFTLSNADEVPPIPEPASCLLLGTGLVALLKTRKAARKAHIRGACTESAGRVPGP